MRKHRIAMLEGALCFTLKFFVPIPKSFSKKRRIDAHEGRILPTSTPDLDNLAKLVMDACNGVLFTDDSYVVDAVLWKRYSNEPHIVIEVEVIP